MVKKFLKRIQSEELFDYISSSYESEIVENRFLIKKYYEQYLIKKDSIINPLMSVLRIILWCIPIIGWAILFFLSGSFFNWNKYSKEYYINEINGIISAFEKLKELFIYSIKENASYLFNNDFNEFLIWLKSNKELSVIYIFDVIPLKEKLDMLKNNEIKMETPNDVVSSSKYFIYQYIKVNSSIDFETYYLYNELIKFIEAKLLSAKGWTKRSNEEKANQESVKLMLIELEKIKSELSKYDSNFEGKELKFKDQPKLSNQEKEELIAKINNLEL